MNDDLLPEPPGLWVNPADDYLDAGLTAAAIANSIGVDFRADALGHAADIATARAQFVEDYASLVEDTRARLTGVAARTALAGLQAVSSAPPGDLSAQAAAQVAQLRGRAEAEETVEQAQDRAGALADGHGSALGALAPLQAMAMMSRAAGGGAHRPTQYAIPEGAPADLEQRLREVCAAVPDGARSWVRLAVASVMDDTGRSWRVIGTTELDGYLRPGVELRPGEIAAGNEAWPELSIATFCAARGFAPGPLVGIVEPPGDVAEHVRDFGFTATWAPDAWTTNWEDADAPLF